jgi:hypothetical protein
VDADTLYLKKQKNGQKGATIHHTAVDCWFCPVRALACQVANLAAQGFDPTTPLSCISLGVHILSHIIVTTICKAARLTDLPAHGYNLKHIGAHSQQASGAMTMKLNNVDTETIKKVGCWTSSTFLIYIHLQIAVLNAGLAQQMVHPIYVHNVGG